MSTRDVTVAGSSGISSDSRAENTGRGAMFDGSEAQSDHHTSPPEVVTSTIRSREIIRSLMKSKKPIAVDCEGVNLGPKGPLTLLQIATCDGQVYLFDIHMNKQLVHEGGLSQLLQSTEVEKVFHSCLHDSGALYYQFSVTLANVFDTQAAHLLIENKLNDDPFCTYIKLEILAEKYGANTKTTTSLPKKWQYIQDFWAKRPLTQAMINYAAGDVMMLVPTVYNNMKRIIVDNQLSEELIIYVDEIVHGHMKSEEIRKQQAVRRNEAINKLFENLEKEISEKQLSLSDLRAPQRHAIWTAGKKQKLPKNVEKMQKTLMEEFLTEKQKLFQENPDKMVCELSNEDRFKIENIARTAAGKVKEQAEMIVNEVTMRSICQIIQKVEQGSSVAIGDRTKIMSVNDEIMPDKARLENAQAWVAGEIERTVSHKLGRDPRNVDKLSKKEKHLLCCTHEKYLETELARQARCILLKRKEFLERQSPKAKPRDSTT